MQIEVTYKNEDGYTMKNTIECSCLDEARVTALDEIIECIEIEDIKVLEE